MRPSTIVSAAIKAQVSALTLLDVCRIYRFDTASPTWLAYKHKQAQADKFRTRAIQLADEQHDLIAAQRKEIEQQRATIRRYGDALDAMTQEYVL